MFLVTVVILVIIMVASVLIIVIISVPGPPPPTVPYPGEVTQYQNYTLTPISTFIYDIAQHPDVAIDGTQNIDQATYHLTITGLVNESLDYTYDDVINDFNSTQQVATLLCVEGWSVTMLWEGVKIDDLLQEAGVSPNATVAIFHASDGYTTALPLDYISQNNLILAYKINNVTLPSATGFPFCLVAQNQYGYKWIKWITEIEVSNDTGYLGFWESRGYPNNATVTNP
jgi:DMSO/TMAO reductase YedYZ molybdopterin-dependent catalytic subunit